MFGIGGTPSNNSSWMSGSGSPSLFNMKNMSNLINNGQGMGSGSYESTSKPFERQVNPLLYGRAERNVEGLATQAGVQAGNALEAQRGINQREMATRGLAMPTSPQDMLNTSLAQAGASNQARQGAEQQNFANLLDIEKLKQGEEQMGLSRWNMNNNGGSGGGLGGLGAMAFGGGKTLEKLGQDSSGKAIYAKGKSAGQFGSGSLSGGLSKGMMGGITQKSSNNGSWAFSGKSTPKQAGLGFGKSAMSIA